MFRKILATIFSKGLTAICGLITLLLTANYLGAIGRGEMALFVLGISIVGLFQNIFSGSVLTFLIPLYAKSKLLTIATLWNVLISAILPVILVYFGLFPKNHLFDLMLLSLILGSITLIQSALLGMEAIYKQNVIEITKAVSTAVFFVFFLIFYQIHSLIAVVFTFYAAYLCTLLVALYCILSEKSEKLNVLKTSNYIVISQFLRIGSQMQVNNISQMINYRFCYYLIEKKLGLSVLGVFSVAVNLIEIIWVICRSISNIHYSKSVNLTLNSDKIRLTQKLAKMSFILTLPCMLILFVIPDQFIAWLLGNDFANFKPIFLTLAPGVLSLAVFTLFNHYFSSIDKNSMNIKASLLGNVVTLLVGFACIDHFGVLSGGIATSCAYLSMFVYLFWKFNTFGELKPSWFGFSTKEIKASFDLKEFDHGEKK